MIGYRGEISWVNKEKGDHYLGEAKKRKIRKWSVEVTLKCDLGGIIRLIGKYCNKFD